MPGTAHTQPNPGARPGRAPHQSEPHPHRTATHIKATQAWRGKCVPRCHLHEASPLTFALPVHGHARPARNLLTHDGHGQPTVWGGTPTALLQGNTAPGARRRRALRIPPPGPPPRAGATTSPVVWASIVVGGHTTAGNTCTSSKHRSPAWGCAAPAHDTIDPAVAPAAAHPCTHTHKVSGAPRQLI